MIIKLIEGEKLITRTEKKRGKTVSPTFGAYGEIAISG